MSLLTLFIYLCGTQYEYIKNSCYTVVTKRGGRQRKPNKAPSIDSYYLLYSSLPFLGQLPKSSHTVYRKTGMQ